MLKNIPDLMINQIWSIVFQDLSLSYSMQIIHIVNPKNTTHGAALSGTII